MNTRIMLIDDSRSFLTGLTELLIKAGYQVCAHTSAISALDALKKLAPDIVICDLHMPDMNGHEFVARLRSQFSLLSIPVLMMTGSEETDSMQKAIESGADAFCAKESIRYSILPQIASLLRLKETHHEAAKGKQLEAVQALIGTYKHEFNNALAILDGAIRKLKKTVPGVVDHPSMETIAHSYERMRETIIKLDELREYEETAYGENTKILKVSG